MAKILRFQDIEAWKKARGLVAQMYDVTECVVSFRKDTALRDQIRRAAISVMSNIAEGFSRQTDREFTNFLHIALGSAAEVKSQLYVALDLHYLTEDQFTDISGKVREISRLIQGFVKYLKTDAGQESPRKSVRSKVPR
jgi:four helix bundle protein